METAPLKNFATWARTALIREVSARMSAVLAPGAIERVEHVAAIKALESAITNAGGGDQGRAHVIDKVAYTWFNRIIALRFMDANRYTGVGVVSPQAGGSAGQPEVLANAKRGVIDSAVVSSAESRSNIASLLDGSRASVDPQGEAYALLLEAYCNHWHKVMPFMFEREGDFTELLIPANLLADDSVLNRAVEVLTEDVCQDVEVIGWLYQFYISERKDEVFAGFKKNKKAGAAEIPAATQLFTPHWIVRYLVENSVGRLWMLNHPDSRLVEKMDYFIAPVDGETDFLKITSPEELTVIDPACGSGHMLTYAFDLLYSIYEEAGYSPADIPALILKRNIFGTEIDPRAGALAAFALSMKARSRQRTLFDRGVEPQVTVIEEVSFTPLELDLLEIPEVGPDEARTFWGQFSQAGILGALIRPLQLNPNAVLERLEESADSGDLLAASILERARLVSTQATALSPSYSAVIANPPYMGSGNMEKALSDWVKKNYSDEKQDLYACFVSRAYELASHKGHVAFVIGDTWMTIKAFEKFRRSLLNDHALLTLLHLDDVSNHPDIFGANAAFVLRNASDPVRMAEFVRLDELNAEAKRKQALAAIHGQTEEGVYRVRTSMFNLVPGAPMVYRIIDQVAPAYASCTSLESVAYTRIGLITGDNDAYIREWYEVSYRDIGFGMSRATSATSGLRWFPISKGGGYRKWFGNTTCVVDWKDDGKELQTRLDSTGKRILAHNFNLDDIFREGVTWSKISSGRFSGRHHPSGFIFNDPSANIFPKDGGVTIPVLLAYLSSNVANMLLQELSPTLNYQPGNVVTLPWPKKLPAERVEKLALEAVAIARADWDEAETSWGFVNNVLVAGADRAKPLGERVVLVQSSFEERAAYLAELECENNTLFIEAMQLEHAIKPSVKLEEVTLSSNPDWALSGSADSQSRKDMHARRLVEELLSYAVGCMFGRYSLDEPGLIIADQGATLQDYLAKVPEPSFQPDADGVIPIVDGDWFEDDIVERFRQFLRVAFGEEHFEENLQFIVDSLGVKSLRNYFVKSFYKDHVQRYKKRPIYWLFSSPKGSFNALIYMHRYTPSTVSTVLNEYLREYEAKLKASLENAERANKAKDADRLRKMLVELAEYEHDVLYPLASQRIEIDLDDGVKANYPKFGAALKKVPGLEAAE